MENFADRMIHTIIENEIPRIDKIMKEVTDKVRDDFVQEAYRLLDNYYDDYTPIRYVRLYGPKRTLRTKTGKTTMKPKPGGVSLHAAIKRMGTQENCAVSGGSYYDGYVGGIIFDEDNFKGNGMRHLGKGKKFEEWNIIENFLFAGEGGYGDIRSYIDNYNAPSADSELWAYMNSYDSILDKHYKNALKKF